MSREASVTQLCQPVVESMGYEWVGVEFHPHPRNAILRIYVDRPDGGIAMDDVVAVTEQLNPLLDVEDPVGTPYTLEVSSPGLDRPLFTLAQYTRFIGCEIKLNTKQPIGGQRKFTGILEAVDLEREEITLCFARSALKDKVNLAFANIDKARLVPVFED